MSAPTQTLREELELEFQSAVMDRHRARFALERKDTPANRAAWRAAAEEIDAVLDCWLESRHDCE